MIRFIIIITEIVLCFLLQTCVPAEYSALGAGPDLLMIVTVGNAYMRGRTTGLLTGFACGLLVDICYGSGLGLCALLYMVVGYFVGYAAKFYIPDDYTFPILLIAAGEFLYSTLYYAVEYMLRGQLRFGIYFTEIILPGVAFTLLSGIILYRIMNGLNVLCMREREPGEDSQNNA